MKDQRFKTEKKKKLTDMAHQFHRQHVIIGNVNKTNLKGSVNLNTSIKCQYSNKSCIFQAYNVNHTLFMDLGVHGKFLILIKKVQSLLQ